MPLCIVLAPVGLVPDARKQLMSDLTAAIEAGYPEFVTEIYLREVPADNLMVAGVAARDNPGFNSHFKQSPA